MPKKDLPDVIGDDKTVSLKNDEFTSSVAEALRSLNPIKTSASIENSFAEYAEVQLAFHHKAAETARQIDRIKPYLLWADESSEATIDKESLNQTIGLLNLLSSTPSPVPMLAIDNDGLASFYLSCDGHSIEAVIENNELEYLYSLGENDQFHNEKIENGKIPPKLLYFLYSQFAKNKVKSEPK